MSVKIDKIASFERGWKDGNAYRVSAPAGTPYYNEYYKGYNAGLSWAGGRLLVQGELFDVQ